MHIIPHCTIGGADRVVLDLIAHRPGTAAHGVVITDPTPSPWLGRLVERGASVWRLPDLAPSAHHPELLLRLVQEWDTDVVQVMNSRLGYDLAPVLAAQTRPPALIAHCHGEAPDGAGYPRYVAGRHPAAFAVFVASSHALAERMRGHGLPADRIKVIPAGIDVAHFAPTERPISEGPATILLPARLWREKDPLLFVDTIAALRERGHAVQGRMLGGPLEQEVRRHIERRGLGGTVTLQGDIDDLRSEYRRADLALLTSITEGIPLALLEALACELPVIATAVGSVGELIDERVGALVAERTPAALADACAALLGDPAQRAALGQEGRRRVERDYAVAVGGDRFLSLYRALAAARAGAAVTA